MILTEIHSIKNKNLFQKIDQYCYVTKNLHNATNYLITQCSRISYKLKQGEVLDSWEKHLIYKVNLGIQKYNQTRPDKTPIKYIDENNGFIADSYFLSWYLKNSKEYKEMPYSVCSQQCIQEVCKSWKAYYQALKKYKKNPSLFLGRPRQVGYLDRNLGRDWLVFTNQNFKIDELDNIKLPKCLEGIHLKSKKTNLQQIRIITRNNKVIIYILYKKDEIQKSVDNNKALSIDLGVNNLTTITSNTSMSPIIINGKPLKSINQYYNKRKTELQEKAKRCNNLYTTKKLCKLSEVRNNKVKDYLHKTSRKIINIALKNNIGTIIIGNNKGWKQNSDMGKRINQNFVSIPYYQLIQQIQYKAELVGIDVKVVEESYTSGTSYLDNELPIKKNYNKKRRIHRGLFRSNKGSYINADVNGSYQIIKKVKEVSLPIKGIETVTKLKVA